jgi:hypothetical protein
MKYRLIAVVGILAANSGQAAAAPGEGGQLALSAERLTGFTHTTQTNEDDTGKTTTSYNYFHFLGLPLGLFTFYNSPRIGLDYFVTDGVSLCGHLTYARVGYSFENEPDMGPRSESDGSLNMWSLGPRGGYAAMFTDGVGIWPRGGSTYIATSSSDDDGDESSASYLALSIEAPLLFLPVNNVAITVGPTIDYGLSASSEYEDVDGSTIDEDEDPTHALGIEAGLTVFF